MNKKISCFRGCLFLAAFHIGAEAHVSDSLTVNAMKHGDSIAIKVTVYEVETQLAFLMQGMSIGFMQPDSMSFSFPSAMMVREKIRRHPNEVKASMDKNLTQGKDITHDGNKIIRPDVRPLVAALNDTTATVWCKEKSCQTQDFIIEVDTEKTMMHFIAMIPYPTDNNTLSLRITSKSTFLGDKPEFEGTRLSKENAPSPNGMGEGLRKGQVDERAIDKIVCVSIKEENDLQ